MFPVLPQPDTSKLLANLQLRQQQQQLPSPSQQQQRLLSAAPQLPNVPLPNSRCFSSQSPHASSSSSPVNPRSKNHLAEPSVSSSSFTACPVSFSSSSHTVSQSSSSSSLSAPVTGRSAHGYNNMLKVDSSKLSAPRIGADFQAFIPPPPLTKGNSNAGGGSGETLMWSPLWAEDLAAGQLEEYLRLCSSAAVAGGGGLSTEEALRILGSCSSDVFQVFISFGFTEVINAVP